jgi:hypothetical protein
MTTPTDPQRYIAHFQPQAWQGDWAIDVDAEGPQKWDCTAFLDSMDLIGHVESAIRCQNKYLDKAYALTNDKSMPEWAKAWKGPYDIYVRHRTQYDTEIPESVDTRPDMINCLSSCDKPGKGWHYINTEGTFCGVKVSEFTHSTKEATETDKVECPACLLKNGERKLTADELRSDLIDACNNYFLNDHAMALIDQLVATLTEGE